MPPNMYLSFQICHSTLYRSISEFYMIIYTIPAFISDFFLFSHCIKVDRFAPDNMRPIFPKQIITVR